MLIRLRIVYVFFHRSSFPFLKRQQLVDLFYRHLAKRSKHPAQSRMRLSRRASLLLLQGRTQFIDCLEQSIELHDCNSAFNAMQPTDQLAVFILWHTLQIMF